MTGKNTVIAKNEVVHVLDTFMWHTAIKFLRQQNSIPNVNDFQGKKVF